MADILELDPMILNHLNLAVTDALAAKDFLEKYFGLCPLEGVRATETFAILLDERQFVLTLMRPGRKGVGIEYPPNFHIGFAQPSESKVNEVYERLKNDGFDVPAPARLHGSWTFYFEAPGGFTVEVLA